MILNDEEHRKAVMQAKGFRAADNLLNGIYKTTHYQTYHSYHKALRFASKLLILAFLIEFISFFPWIVNKTLLSSIGLLLFVIYLLYYYWIMSKARGLKADSKKVMEMIAVNGYVCKSWSIYDGLFTTTNHESLEIAFSKEHTYLYNLWTIFKHKNHILPPSSKDIEGLKNYLFNLSKIDNNGIHYVAYATLTSTEAELLRSYNIILTSINNRFVTKPNRIDFAAGMGELKYALTKFPKDFKAYLLSVDNAEFLNEQKEKLNNEQHEKELNKKMIKLH